MASKRCYLQVYVISKLSLMFTMSIWGRSLGGSVSWDNANLKAACSWDCWLGNNPPGEKKKKNNKKKGFKDTRIGNLFSPKYSYEQRLQLPIPGSALTLRNPPARKT